jgi:hypothetical protein
MSVVFLIAGVSCFPFVYGAARRFYIHLLENDERSELLKLHSSEFNADSIRHLSPEQIKLIQLKQEKQWAELTNRWSDPKWRW